VWRETDNFIGLPPPAHSGGKSWHFQGLNM
jgi:hypothetical protein